MTDKDIKDYCKNCSVEPPAMKFKCPECKYNPDNKNNLAKDINVPHKKQIIIDGVDVSGCKYLPYCNDKQGNCAFEPNCYFKQLARKTQEFEQLQEKYEALKLKNEEGYEIVDELTQECEELKEELELLNMEKERKELVNRVITLVYECEELKSELHLYKTWYRAKHDDIKNTLGRYHKALEEIEKIVTQDRNIKDVCLVSTCFEEDRIMYDIQEEILYIINKVKRRI